MELRSYKDVLTKHLSTVPKTDGLLLFTLKGDAKGHVSLQVGKLVTVREIYTLLQETVRDLLEDGERVQVTSIPDLPRSRSHELWKNVLGFGIDSITLGIPFPMQCLVVVSDDAFETPTHSPGPRSGRVSKPLKPLKQSIDVAPFVPGEKSPVKPPPPLFQGKINLGFTIYLLGTKGTTTYHYHKYRHRDVQVWDCIECPKENHRQTRPILGDAWQMHWPRFPMFPLRVDLPGHF